MIKMTSFGRRSTFVWGFRGTTVGTASAVDIVDDERAAESTQSSGEARTVPKRVKFASKKKSQNKVVDDQESEEVSKEARVTPNHARITGVLALISAYVA